MGTSIGEDDCDAGRAQSTLADWTFLDPWRDVLRPLLEYVDDDELAVGTLDNRLQCLRLHLNHAHARLKEVRAERTARENLVWIHEALELIGLVLHYDRRAWRLYLHPVTWDRVLARDPFLYEETIDTFAPVFKITLYEPGPDRPAHFQDLCDLFTTVTPEMLSNDYYAARQRIELAVGTAWDPSYLIPLWLVTIPKQVIQDSMGWVRSIRKVLKAFQNPRRLPASTFQLASFTTLLFWAPLQMWVVDLLEEVGSAGVTVKQFGLPLWRADRVTMGIALNAATGFGTVYRDWSPSMEWLSVEESALDAVIATSSSVAQASHLERVELCEVLPTEEAERAVCWRWLGYALTNRFHASSVRDVKFYQNHLYLRDVPHFLDEGSAVSGSLPVPPVGSQSQFLRVVCLAATARIQVNTTDEWRSLRELRLADQDSFTLFDDDGGSTDIIQILVPGFGVCKAKCEDIVDAGVLPRRDTRACPLDRLELDLASCEAPALPRFLNAIGSGLLRLCVMVNDELTLTKEQSRAVLAACPLLESLHLRSVNVDTMAVFIDAYRERKCRIRVLSLVDSYVCPSSMMLFAWELGNVESRVASNLREFRYVYEVTDGSHDRCPTIISSYTASLFVRALHHNTPLKMLDLGLTRPVYDKHHEALKAHDRPIARAAWQRCKAALISVVADRLPAAKRSRGQWTGCLPSPQRRAVTTRILHFARPRLDCAISVIYVPRAVVVSPVAVIVDDDAS